MVVVPQINMLMMSVQKRLGELPCSPRCSLGLLQQLLQLHLHHTRGTLQASEQIVGTLSRTGQDSSTPVTWSPLDATSKSADHSSRQSKAEVGTCGDICAGLACATHLAGSSHSL